MQVLYLNTEDLSRDVASGRVHFWAVARELSAAGCHLTIVAPRYRCASLDIPPGLKHSLIPVPGKNAFSLLLFELLLGLSVPWIVWRRRPQVLLVRGGGPGFIPGLIFLAFRALGVKVVLECNGITWQEFVERGFRPHVVAMVRQSAWQQAWTCNHIIAVTREIGEAYARLAARPATIATEIPNGVDPSEFTISSAARHASRFALGFAEDTCVAGYVGSFSVWHGIPEILHAAAILREQKQDSIVFVLVGQGEEFTRSQTEVTSQRLTNVRLLGAARDRQELRAWMASFDVGLCTNYPIQGSPLKYFEYLAAGVPLVVSGSPQMLRLISAEGSGIGMDEPTGEQIAAALESIQRDAATWKRVGENNRRLAEEVHSWRNVAARVRQVLEQVVRN